MKKTMSLALGALILIGGIFYFSNNEKENKVLVNTKTETSPQKEEKKVEKTQKIETSKTEVKKEITNPRGPVIYKNTPENEGYNMELKVPAKWAHLDYSRLGNPKEVELPKEEWAAGDQLYSKDDSRYYDDGKKYFSAEAEKILLDIFQDRDTLRYIIDDDQKADELFEKYFNDINKLIYVDEETGRKMFYEGSEYVNGNEVRLFDKFFDIFIENNIWWDKTEEFIDWYKKAKLEISEKEIGDISQQNEIYRKWAMRKYIVSKKINTDFVYMYHNNNIQRYKKEDLEYFNEFCAKGLDNEECELFLDEQLMYKYLN